MRDFIIRTCRILFYFHFRVSDTFAAIATDRYGKIGGKELFYQDALHSKCESLTIPQEFDLRTQGILVNSSSPPSLAQSSIDFANKCRIDHGRRGEKNFGEPRVPDKNLSFKKISSDLNFCLIMTDVCKFSDVGGSCSPQAPFPLYLWFRRRCTVVLPSRASDFQIDSWFEILKMSAENFNRNNIDIRKKIRNRSSSAVLCSTYTISLHSLNY